MKLVEVIKKGAVIHCATKEESDRILLMLHAIGKGWVRSPAYESKSYNLLEQDYWNVFKQNTIYNPWSSYSNVSIGQVAYGNLLSHKHMTIVESSNIDGIYKFVKDENILVPLPPTPGRKFYETDIEREYKGATIINAYALDLSKSSQIKVDTTYKSTGKTYEASIYPHTVIHEILDEEKIKFVSYYNLVYDKDQIEELLVNKYLIRLIYAKETV
jgi:hypothetical protein